MWAEEMEAGRMFYTHLLENVVQLLFGPLLLVAWLGFEVGFGGELGVGVEKRFRLD